MLRIKKKVFLKKFLKLNNNNNVKQELMLILFNNLYSGNFKIVSFRKTTETQRRNQISLYKVTEVSLHVLFLKIHFKTCLLQCSAVFHRMK